MNKYKAIAQQLSSEPYTGFFDAIQQAFINKWSNESLIKTNEYDTLVATIRREARMEGIRIMREEIEKIAQHD